MLIIEARAKVNLYLHVGETRPDGFHNIQTIFHSITLSDRLEIEDAVHLRVTSSSPDVPDGPENLAYRAARLLQQTAGIQRGARIHIHKNIPSQAGMGGGSTDAAAALVALNRLWNLGAEPQELESLAARLGADVPFCIRGGAAYADGVGDRLRPLGTITNGWMVIIKPDVPVSTAAAYRMLDGTARQSGPSAAEALSALPANGVERLPSVLYNDFEQVILPTHPEVRRAHAALQDHTRGALLCGSGSAVFGLVQNRGEAEAMMHRIHSPDWQVYSAAFAAEGSRFLPFSE